jgi:hypothetical protein
VKLVVQECIFSVSVSLSSTVGRECRLHRKWDPQRIRFDTTHNALLIGPFRESWKWLENRNIYMFLGGRKKIHGLS